MDPKSITFYHHSKGSTYKNPNVDKWTMSMYHFNLCDRNIKIVEDQISNGKIFAGIFRVNHPSPPWVNSDWHFSGTFFWISYNLFKINGWNTNHVDRFSTESYPGLKVPIELSHNIDDISNMGCDLRYSYFWGDVFPNVSQDEDFKKLILDEKRIEYKKDISEKETAWEGHYDFALDIVNLISPKMIVDLS